MQNEEPKPLSLLFILHSAFCIHHSAFPMQLLGIDVGSSSVIAGILRGDRVVKESPRAFFRTRHGGGRAEVEPSAILKAVREAVGGLGTAAKRVDAVSLAVMAPSWVAMDAAGDALTPVV